MGVSLHGTSTRCPPMSNAPHYSDRGDPAPTAKAVTVLETAGQIAIKQTRALGFWSAVALPFLYLPLLAAGLETVTETTAVLALLVLNLLALLVGRGYNTD